MMTELAAKKCKPCEGGTPALTGAQTEILLKEVPGWNLAGHKITRTFGFKNYYETVSFVNAAAWIAHREDHHPDMTFGYKQCQVTYWTHAAGGLTENDFICAAKINALLG